MLNNFIISKKKLIIALILSIFILTSMKFIILSFVKNKFLGSFFVTFIKYFLLIIVLILLAPFKIKKTYLIYMFYICVSICLNFQYYLQNTNFFYVLLNITIIFFIIIIYKKHYLKFLLKGLIIGFMILNLYTFFYYKLYTLNFMSLSLYNFTTEVLNRNVIAYILSLGFLIIYFEKLNYFFKIIYFAVYIMNMLYLMSKTSIMAVFVSLIIVNILKNFKLVRFISIFLIILILSLLLQEKLVEVYTSYATHNAGEAISTLTGRTIIWQETFNYIKNESWLQILFGNGFLSSKIIFKQMFNNNIMFLTPPNNAHNEILNSLVVFGIIGTLYIAYTAIKIFFIFIQNRKKNNYDYIFFLLYIFFIIRGLVEVSITNGGIGLYLYILIYFNFNKSNIIKNNLNGVKKSNKTRIL